MTKKLHNLITYLFYTLILLTPLIYFTGTKTGGTNEAFEFPKMTFVYLLGALIILLFFIKRVLTNDYKFIKTKANLPILLFLLANILSTIFSINKYTSTWGYYTRFNGGLISIIIFTFLYFIFINEFSEEEKDTTLTLILFTTIPVCIYAILQNLGIAKWRGTYQVRAFSTFGQPNWLAAYLVVTIFPAIYKTLENQKWTKALFFLITILNYAAIWFTYSLSGLLGLGIGALVFVLFLNKSFLKKELKTLGLILGVCVLIGVLRLGVIKPKLHDAIQDVKRKVTQNFIVYAEESNTTESDNKTADEEPKDKFGDTTAIRLIVWKGTKDLILSSPKVLIIGTGPETFPYAFPPFRPTELNETSEWNFIFNKPHNYYLELLANLGIIGFFTYILLMKNVFSKIKDQKYLPLCAGLLALFVTDVFGWHTVATSMLLYVCVALMQGRDEKYE